MLALPICSNLRFGKKKLSEGIEEVRFPRFFHQKLTFRQKVIIFVQTKGLWR